MLLTHAELLETLYYSKWSGEFFYIKPTKGQRMGSRAGSVVFLGAKKNRPYRVITIKGKSYLEHRLAWFYMAGEWPPELVDHKNRNGLDNSFDNLRLASNSQNAGNARLSRANTSGRKGVYWHRKLQKWCAQIRTGNVTKNLGYFDDLDKAAEVYAHAAREKFGEFARVQ